MIYYIELLLILILVITTGCGGGGDGANNAPLSPVSYVGKTTPAYVSADNAKTFISAVLGYGSEPLQSAVSVKIGDSGDNHSIEEQTGIAALRKIAAHASARIHSSELAAADLASAVAVNETIDGAVGGNIKFVGNLDELGTGHLSVTWNQLDDGDGYTINGKAKIEIINVQEMVLDIERLTVEGPALRLNYGGVMRYKEPNLPRTIVLTLDINIYDELNNAYYKYKDFSETVQFATFSYEEVASISFEGRVYIGHEGYIDVSTESRLAYCSDCNDLGPMRGGPLLFRGENNSLVSISPVSEYVVLYEFDLDGDNILETTEVKYWPFISVETVPNQPPVVFPRLQKVLQVNTEFEIDEIHVIDIEQDELSYSWVVTRQPVNSSPVIVRGNTAHPIFMTGNQGDYELNLTVSDGKNSAKGYVSITAEPMPIFKPYIQIELGGAGEAVAIGDINNDGMNDVVVSTSSLHQGDNSSCIIVFLQDSAGNLSSPIVYRVGIDPTFYLINSVDLADMNNDGLTDVVFSHDGGVGILLQNPSGVLDPVVIYPTDHADYINPAYVRAADLNNDGLTDLASIGPDFSTTSDVEIHLQNLNGTVDSAISYSLSKGGFSDFGFLDMNGDGRTDIIGISSWVAGIEYLGILYQNSDGGFERAVYHSLGDLFGPFIAMELGDINRDGLGDVIYGHGANSLSEISLLKKNFLGDFEPPESLPAYNNTLSMKLADINGDGETDVIVAHPSRLGIYLQKDGGLLQEQIFSSFSTSHNAQALSVGDINSDGRIDVVIANGRGVHVHYNKLNDEK